MYIVDTKKWSKDGAHVKAVKGSSIAVVSWGDADGLVHFKMFYQDPKLCLREYLYDISARRLVSGEPVLEICSST